MDLVFDFARFFNFSGLPYKWWMANYFGGWYFFLNSVKSYECQIMELSMTSVYVCGSLNDTMQHGYISFKNLAAWKC